jgi:hypothetical protein
LSARSLLVPVSYQSSNFLFLRRECRVERERIRVGADGKVDSKKREGGSSVRASVNVKMGNSMLDNRCAGRAGEGRAGI